MSSRTISVAGGDGVAEEVAWGSAAVGGGAVCRRILFPLPVSFAGAMFIFAFLLAGVALCDVVGNRICSDGRAVDDRRTFRWRWRSAAADAYYCGEYPDNYYRQQNQAEPFFRIEGISHSQSEWVAYGEMEGEGVLEADIEVAGIACVVGGVKAIAEVSANDEYAYVNPQSHSGA